MISYLRLHTTTFYFRRSVLINTVYKIFRISFFQHLLDSRERMTQEPENKGFPKLYLSQSYTTNREIEFGNLIYNIAEYVRREIGYVSSSIPNYIIETLPIPIHSALELCK